MTPLRALELLANPDALGLDAALHTLATLDPAQLSPTEQLQMLAALDTAIQTLQPQHAAVTQQLQALRQAAGRVQAYRQP